MSAERDGSGATITGGQALARQLAAEGITDLFAIPGVQLDYAVDALRQAQNQIRLIVPRHEQATSYMADGYARSTGRIGACMVVPGPGVLNAMSGLATAYACHSRVLCVAGNINSGAIDKGYGLLHEIRGQSAILGAVTKWTGAAARPQDVPSTVREAVRRIDDGATRPVAVELPDDVLAARAEIATVAPVAEDGRARPDPAAIEAAAALIAAARFPVLYVGGGIRAAGAEAALRDLAERAQAPVIMSENGRGALSDRHGLAFNALCGRAMMPHADLVVVIGSRFCEGANGQPAWSQPGQKRITIDTDPATLAPPRGGDVTILADARLAAEALAAAVDRRHPPEVDLDAVRAWADAQTETIQPQTEWLRALRAAMPEDAFLVNELTQAGYMARFSFPVYQPGTFITPGYQGTLGYGFPTALGVAVGNPGRAVVSINGDGGFGYGVAELATARKYDLGVVAVVFNDGHFGNVRTLMQSQFDAAYGTDLRNPHFDRLAAAYDLPFHRVEAPAELERAVKAAIAAGGPCLIEARVGPMPSPWHLMRLKPLGFAKGPPAPPNPLGVPPAQS